LKLLRFCGWNEPRRGRIQLFLETMVTYTSAKRGRKWFSGSVGPWSREPHPKRPVPEANTNIESLMNKSGTTLTTSLGYVVAHPNSMLTPMASESWSSRCLRREGEGEKHSSCACLGDGRDRLYEGKEILMLLR
jgi:hypothetical protein